MCGVLVPSGANWELVNDGFEQQMRQQPQVERFDVKLDRDDDPAPAKLEGEVGNSASRIVVVGNNNEESELEGS